MTAPSAHDLTVMVDAAYARQRDRLHERYGITAGTDDPVNRMDAKQQMLDVIYPAVAKLPELGWVRQRTITTIEELDSLNVMTVIRDDQQFVLEKMTDANNGTGWYCTADPRPIPAQAVDLPAVVLYEPEPTR